jgi:ABC-type antimicrobial peptide transport system ATPase subunit
MYIIKTYREQIFYNTLELLTLKRLAKLQGDMCKFRFKTILQISCDINTLKEWASLSCVTVTVMLTGYSFHLMCL